MSQLISLGAINKNTGEYVYPKIANKKDEDVCPGCNKDLILVKGEIRVHHFRHKVDSINPCHHYSKPTESQIHKDAKMLMKSLLENKTHIQFIRECVSCKINAEINLPEIIETEMTDSSIIEGSIISLEYQFNFNDELRIADVAHTHNGEIKGIYEIYNTHKTCSENRPEPWVEIDAKSLLTLVNASENQSLIINCIRCEKCEECITKEREIKLNIRKDVESKSSFEESDSYCCYSSDIMHILINIICGDDTYEQWSNCYRVTYPSEKLLDGEEGSSNPIEWEYAKSNMNEDIKLGCDSLSTGCDIYYDEELIRDIQGMYLYKYLKRLIVSKGHPEITMSCDNITDMDRLDIDDKLEKLCTKLCGVNCTVVWKTSDISDDNTFIYLKIPFSKKDMIKKLGGKWVKEHKLWRIPNSIYTKNETYIHDVIKGIKHRQICDDCDGKRVVLDFDEFEGCFVRVVCDTRKCI